MGTLPSKQGLRSDFRLLRKNLSKNRRFEAKTRVFDTLLRILKPYKRILSFSSLPDEIDLSTLNAALLQEKKLYLPRLEKNAITPYQALEGQLKLSPYNILEPTPSSPTIDKCDLDCILVPALCFDKSHYRLGYGKGHFDRFLQGITAPILGIGFQEQLVDALPRESHDIPMTDIYLF